MPSSGGGALTGGAGPRGRSSGDVPHDQLAVIVAVAVERLERLCPLEVEVEVVLPGEPDAAVDLDRLAADLARGVPDVRLRDRGGQRGVLGPGVERPRGV